MVCYMIGCVFGSCIVPWCDNGTFQIGDGVTYTGELDRRRLSAEASSCPLLALAREMLPGFLPP